MQLWSNELTTCIDFGLNLFGVEDPWWISQGDWLSKWLWCVEKKRPFDDEGGLLGVEKWEQKILGICQWGFVKW